VLLMHDRIAELDLRQVAQHAFGGRPARPFASAAGPCDGRIELRLRHHREARTRMDEAVQHGRHGEHHRIGRAEECVEGLAHDRMQTILGEVREHRLASPEGLGNDQRAQPASIEKRIEPRERMVRTAVRLHVGQRGGEAALSRRGTACHLDARKALDRAEQCIGREVEILRRQHRTRAVPLQDVVTRIGVAPELQRRVLELAVQADGRLLGQVVDQGRGVLEEQRQIVFDPRGRQALAHVLVERRS